MMNDLEVANAKLKHINLISRAETLEESQDICMKFLKDTGYNFSQFSLAENEKRHYTKRSNDHTTQKEKDRVIFYKVYDECVNRFKNNMNLKNKEFRKIVISECQRKGLSIGETTYYNYLRERQ